MSGKVKESMPFFSVIIPTYNRARLLPESIASVLVQTYQSWELIIVDDGSMDNTKEVVESFKDQRIKYIFQKNQERSAARNNGIKNSSGRYICFLDSDDYYLPDHLEKLFEFLRQGNFPASFFYTNKLLKHGSRIIRASEDLLICENIYDQIVSSVIHTQQVCAHRDVFKEHLFDPKFRISEDTELWLRIADDFKIVPINQFTVVIVEHPERTINNNVSQEMLRTVRFFLSKKHSGNKISKSKQKELVSNCFFSISKYHLMERKYLAGLYNLIRSITEDLSHPQTRFKLNIALRVLVPIDRRKTILALLQSASS